jgi:hypothetical protein
MTGALIASASASGVAPSNNTICPPFKSQDPQLIWFEFVISFAFEKQHAYELAHTRAYQSSSFAETRYRLRGQAGAADRSEVELAIP